MTTIVYSATSMTYTDYKKAYNNLNHNVAVLHYLFIAVMTTKRPIYYDVVNSGNDGYLRPLGRCQVGNHFQVAY